MTPNAKAFETGWALAVCFVILPTLTMMMKMMKTNLTNLSD
jgi:hypothetical protein